MKSKNSTVKIKGFNKEKAHGHSKETLDLSDGIYKGEWSGYEVHMPLNKNLSYKFRTDIGIRGRSSVWVKVENGTAYVFTNKDEEEMSNFAGNNAEANSAKKLLNNANRMKEQRKMIRKIGIYTAIAFIGYVIINEIITGGR